MAVEAAAVLVAHPAALAADRALAARVAVAAQAAAIAARRAKLSKAIQALRGAGLMWNTVR